MAKFQMSEEEWFGYYTYILSVGLITINQLEEKFKDYESRIEEWMKSPDKISYMNGQVAMLKIINALNKKEE